MVYQHWQGRRTEIGKPRRSGRQTQCWKVDILLRSYIGLSSDRELPLHHD